MIYNSPKEYVAQSDCTIAQRIQRIYQTIAAYEAIELTAAGMADVSDYLINDGQSIVKTTLRDPESIGRAIRVLEKRAARLTQQIKGGVVQQVHATNLTGRFGFGYY